MILAPPLICIGDLEEDGLRVSLVPSQTVVGVENLSEPLDIAGILSWGCQASIAVFNIYDIYIEYTD